MLEEIIISFLQRYPLHLLNDLSNVNPKHQSLTSKGIKMSYNLKSKGIKKYRVFDFTTISCGREQSVLLQSPTTTIDDSCQNEITLKQ